MTWFEYGLLVYGVIGLGVWLLTTKRTDSGAGDISDCLFVTAVGPILVLIALAVVAIRELRSWQD